MFLTISINFHKPMSVEYIFSIAGVFTVAHIYPADLIWSNRIESMIRAKSFRGQRISRGRGFFQHLGFSVVPLLGPGQVSDLLSLCLRNQTPWVYWFEKKTNIVNLTVTRGILLLKSQKRLILVLLDSTYSKTIKLSQVSSVSSVLWFLKLGAFSLAKSQSRTSYRHV